MLSFLDGSVSDFIFISFRRHIWDMSLLESLGNLRTCYICFEKCLAVILFLVIYITPWSKLTVCCSKSNLWGWLASGIFFYDHYLISGFILRYLLLAIGKNIFNCLLSVHKIILLTSKFTEATFREILPLHCSKLNIPACNVSDLWMSHCFFFGWLLRAIFFLVFISFFAWRVFPLGWLLFGSKFDDSFSIIYFGSNKKPKRWGNFLVSSTELSFLVDVFWSFPVYTFR